MKIEINRLLQSLVNEVKNIDRKHQDLVMGTRLPADAVADHRSLLSQYRQQITKKLQDCERAGLIKG